MNAVMTKVRPIEQHMIQTEGFYFAKVTMYKQNPYTRETTDIVETYEGLIKETESGIIYMIRPQANMRSRHNKQILTVSQRLISIEKVSA